MNSITLDNIKTFRDKYNMALMICSKSDNPKLDKKPESYWTGKYKSNGKKEYVWRTNPTEGELLKAERIALIHRPQTKGISDKANFLTIDFDCKEFIANKFSPVFPCTFTIGKEHGNSIRTTHLEYEIDPKDKPRHLPEYEGSIEALGSTCSIIAGVDRHIIDGRAPTRLSKAELERVLELVKVVNFFRECVKVFPPKGKKKRDKFHLRLAGALLDTELSTKDKQMMVERLCKITDDEDEIDNRVNKIEYVEKKPEDAFRIKGLCEYAGVDHTSPLAKAFDELKPSAGEDGDKEKTKLQGLATLTLDQFIERNYPPIEYYMYPIISNECLGMIFALPGKGKTLFAMELAWRCSQGIDFMHWKYNGLMSPPPTLYVEGEMSAKQIQDRLVAMTERDKDKIKDLKNFHIAVLKEQPNESYQKLKTEEGRFNVELAAEAIYKETGKKPIIFLDNIRFLMGNFNEKEGQEWIDFVLWLATLRAKGYSTYFLHHAVNTGEKASGSGYQDSNLDVSIKLSDPADYRDAKYSADHFTQIQFEFKKMRENVIGQMTPHIMVVDKDKGSWFRVPVLNKTERIIKSLLDDGKGAKDIISDKEGMSKANVHKVINKLKGADDGTNRQTINGKAKEVC
jgi:hypothetical protein